MFLELNNWILNPDAVQLRYNRLFKIYNADGASQPGKRHPVEV